MTKEKKNYFDLILFYVMSHLTIEEKKKKRNALNRIGNIIDRENS